MLTDIGKFLRKLRVDNREILKNMADKLNVNEYQSLEEFTSQYTGE